MGSVKLTAATQDQLKASVVTRECAKNGFGKYLQHTSQLTRATIPYLESFAHVARDER